MALGAALGQALRGTRAVIDGEGKSDFYDLMRRRGERSVYAFDVLHFSGTNLRDWPLVRRKALLRELLPSGSDGSCAHRRRRDRAARDGV